MTTDQTDPRPDGPAAEPLALRLNDQLGPVPAPRLYGPSGTAPIGYDADQMRAYAAKEVAAERERCDALTDDMLRYAMAAIGTGSPADADKFRRFWRFAIEARNTKA